LGSEKEIGWGKNSLEKEIKKEGNLPLGEEMKIENKGESSVGSENQKGAGGTGGILSRGSW